MLKIIFALFLLLSDLWSENGKLEVFRNQENKLKRNTTYFVKHENLA